MAAQMSATFALLALLVFPAVVIAAAVRDATSYTIPNWMSGLAAASFFPAALIMHLTLAQWGVALGVGLAALAAGVVMFALGWIGGGDAKLFAACGLWLGWPAFLPFLLWTALAGGALATGLLVARRGARAWPVAGPQWLVRLLSPEAAVPYGVAIAVGALASFPESALMLSRAAGV